MIKHFYSHIVETDSLFMEIDSLEITDEEKTHLKDLAESHIHQSIFDVLLSEMKTYEDKHEFLGHVQSRHQENIWKFLNSRIENVEDKIKDAAQAIKVELHKDLKEAKAADTSD